MHVAVSPLVEDLRADGTVTGCVDASDEDAAVAALTRRLVAGEEAAWEEFHARYFERLRRYLFVLCRGDEQAAGEALQAAFVRIARHVRRFDREEALWGWLAVVARSCAVDGARGRSRYTALMECYAGWFRGPVAPPREDALAALLAECLEGLPPEDRALLAAKYDEGESTAALAARAGCSVKALESRLARLRGRLKEQLRHRLRHED
ncbi:MAG TPA: sigma-70 family RNA polymerase sigma factor [Chthoniobacterales bacterium]|jgi:RNA polymerase sigma factor (sigma-70 family)